MLDAAEAAKKKAESYAEAQRLKKEKKAKLKAASKAGQQAAANADQPEFTKMEIRVGQIKKVCPTKVPCFFSMKNSYFLLNIEINGTFFIT